MPGYNYNPTSFLVRLYRGGKRDIETGESGGGMVSPPPPPPPPPPPLAASREEILEPVAHFFGFKFEDISPHKITGSLRVTTLCCQPSKVLVLHGGVMSVVAEGMASMGAFVASGWQRVAGIHLSINHFKIAEIGDLVLAEATPLSSGKSIQVWEVRFWKIVSSNSENRSLISSSTVTVASNMPMPEHFKDFVKVYRKYARL